MQLKSFTVRRRIYAKSIERAVYKTPFKRPIAHNLHKLSVVRANLTAMNETTFIIVDYLHQNMLKIESSFGVLIHPPKLYLQWILLPSEIFLESESESESESAVYFKILYFILI